MTKTVTFNVQALTSRPKHAKILVYGDAGVGKTTFAASAPRPILWLDSEGGTHSIGDQTDIDHVSVTGIDTFRQALSYLQQHTEYKTVVIDSLTEAQGLVLREIMKTVVAQSPQRDEFTPQFQEWGRVTGIMREITRAYRDHPTHLVVTALAREDTDNLTGRVRVRPRLSPTIADELPGYMDIAAYLYTRNAAGGEVGAEDDETSASIRVALLQPTEKYAAKIRAPQDTPAPSYVTNPTFSDLTDLLFRNDST